MQPTMITNLSDGILCDHYDKQRDTAIPSIPKRHEFFNNLLGVEAFRKKIHLLRDHRLAAPHFNGFIKRLHSPFGHD